MSDITILVVDDESRMRKLIKDFLVQKNYNILEAEDGERALKVYEENKQKIMQIMRISKNFHTFATKLSIN